MKYSSLLIDVSNLYHKAYSTSMTLTMETPEGTLVTGGIYTFIKMIQRLQREYLEKGGKFYFLFDNTSSVESRRKQIDPDYKANRYKKDPVFYKGLDFLNLILTSYENGWLITRRPGSEADDLVAATLQNIPMTGKALLVSGDLDWARAMSDKVDWLHDKWVEGKRYDEILNKESFKELYGYDPSHRSVCLYKSFRGDASDNIAIGVERIPEAVLLHIVEKYKDLPDLYRKLNEDEEIPVHWKEAIQERKARLALNYSLVDFDLVSRDDYLAHTVVTKFEPNTLKRLYGVLGFSVAKLDPRFTMNKVITVEEEDSFFDFEDYTRA